MDLNIYEIQIYSAGERPSQNILINYTNIESFRLSTIENNDNTIIYHHPIRLFDKYCYKYDNIKYSYNCTIIPISKSNKLSWISIEFKEAFLVTNCIITFNHVNIRKKKIMYIIN